MRIIHYVPSIDNSSGGVGVYMSLLSKEMGKMVELHIMTHHSKNPIALDNCIIHYLPHWNHFINLKNQVRELYDIINPDVVHVNCCWIPECSLVQKWAWQRGIKTVYTPHGMLEPWIIGRHYWTKKLPALLLYQRRAIKRATAIHATAASEKDNLMRIGYNKNVVVIPNGIDVAHIKVKEKWHRNRKILFLSRIHVKKGVDFLIEAISRLKEELCGYQIIIAGDGTPSYIEEMKLYAKSNGVDEMIQFVGGEYGEQKWNLFREADVFILPTHSENFGLVVAESLACGTPVITTTGTPWQNLNKEKCGWCVNIGTESLVNAIIDYTKKTDDELEEMGRNGRKLVEDHYSILILVDRMIQVYQKLIC